MLRYRSYSVDFLRKPKVMLEDPEIKSIDDLMDKVPKNVGLLLDLGHLNISSKFFNFNKK